MKKILIIISLIAIGIVPFFLTRCNLSPNVNIKNIKKITIDMPKEEVIKILGTPFEIQQKPENTEGKISYTMRYSKSIFYCKCYPMLWITLTDNKVSNVYSKKYYSVLFNDEECIYNLTSNQSFEAPNFLKLFPN
ncbi:MAG: hypothetical protein ACD_79C00988G0011 [uncultured bacterium]|nr:MAG: hypothetical protein ACD_79C00988G0011 [uncultured bacterium]